MAKNSKQVFTPEQSDAMVLLISKVMDQKIGALLPEPAEVTIESDTKVHADGTVEYTDPVVGVCDNVVAKALNTLPMGTKIIKTRSGTVIINQSMETLEAVENFKMKRRLGRSRSFQK